MPEWMVRTHILLELKQHRRLEELDQKEGKSISAVTRQVIDTGLTYLDSESEIWKKRSLILAELRKQREKQSILYTGDLVNEAREERDKEGDQIWGQAI